MIYNQILNNFKLKEKNYIYDYRTPNVIDNQNSKQLKNYSNMIHNQNLSISLTLKFKLKIFNDKEKQKTHSKSKILKEIFLFS